MPQRIQRRRTPGWRMPDGAVYVGRPTKWGNPRKVGHMVTVTSAGVTTRRGMTAAEVADFFRVDLRNNLLERITTADVVRELAGRDLACWCPLDQPCHADVLLEIANGES